MKHIKVLILFFLVNFGALILGGLFTGSGVSSEWYNNLNQAPWTPPGWVFGLAWTSIMVCFSFYMTSLYQSASSRKNLMILFALQWVLNVSWNPIFFHFQLTGFALAIICLLTLVVACFLIFFTHRNTIVKILLMPYFLWLIIATSLNLYIFLYN